LTPKAEDMAGAIKGCLTTLTRAGVLESASLAYVIEAIRSMDGNKKSWGYVINPSRPLKFRSYMDPYLDFEISPFVYMDIAVDNALAKESMPPFKRLVVTLEVRRQSDSSVIYRSHLDLANKEGNPACYQRGPLHHIQFGGHVPRGDRELDLRLKIPRWPYPPMDVVLICETVVANFYPEIWDELKNQKAWKEYIKQSQKFCFHRYFEKATKCIEDGRSLLLEMQAANWGI
jgi:hypothetical protein